MSMESINAGGKPVFRFLIEPSFQKVKRLFGYHLKTTRSEQLTQFIFSQRKEQATTVPLLMVEFF